MWLAVCEPRDEAALWAVVGLRRLGLVPFEVVLPGELLIESRVVHRIERGGATVDLGLRDGREIRGAELRGVLNRLHGVPAEWAGRIPAGERDYLVGEAHALLVSLLSALECPVLNPASPESLAGQWRDPAEWRLLAARVGLDALPYRVASWEEEPWPSPFERTSTLVVGDTLCGAMPVGLGAGCLALAQAVGSPLLEVGWAVDADGRWRFDTATSTPDLRVGGDEALTALAAALGGS